MYQHARAISDNSRRDFHPQVKSQLAIDANRRRAMLQQQHSILRRCDNILEPVFLDCMLD